MNSHSPHSQTTKIQTRPMEILGRVFSWSVGFQPASLCQRRVEANAPYQKTAMRRVEANAPYQETAMRRVEANAPYQETAFGRADWPQSAARA